MNRVFISLRSLVTKKVGKVTVSLQNETIPVMVLQPHMVKKYQDETCASAFTTRTRASMHQSS